MSKLALTALGLGLLSASALLVGAVMGLARQWSDRLVAAIMAFGAGTLISALAFDLVAEGHERAGFLPVGSGFLIGAVVFVLANQAINAHGGFLRKPATLYRFLREQRRRHATKLLERMSRIDLIRALPPEDLQGLVPFIEACRYSAGQTIFRQGDPGDALYLIESGTVEIHRHGSPQEPTAVVTLGPGEAIGELALLAGHPHHSTASAKTDVHLWRIRKDRLALIAERSPRLAAAVQELRDRHLPGQLSTGNVAGLRAQRSPRAEATRWHARALSQLNRNQAAMVGFTATEHALHAQSHAGESAPMAIFMGALLDGIPESVVIGSSLLSTAAFNPVFVIAVFLSNFPEALSSAAGMRRHGYSPAHVLGLWGGLVILSGLAALLGNVLLTGAPEWMIAGTEAVAAGGILAMLADTMMPEAFEQGGPFVALWTALGFLAAFFVKSQA
ncbi:MAG: cyclic nucleotide-binding domain-containing protein [Deltaproteobacteria bacterium]|nr:cyclic nucleotide-binding domain-containing protein [Deltaproteobacteria bacterium]MBI2992341.1 cyclic nucleotide-binding domain-containing protein [Deltaproteobacteria bacterium]